MADEPKKDHPEDIESILSDLDAILTDMGGDAKAAPANPPKAPPPAAPAPVKAEAPKPAPPPDPAPIEAPKPKPALPPEPAPIEPPKAKPPVIELAPREGIILPPAAKPPAAPPAPAPAEPPKAPPAAPPPPPPVKAPELVKPPAAPAAAPPAPVEPPKAPPPAVAPPSPTAVPAPGPVVGSTKVEELPASTPKEQIRRVAYIYTSAAAEVKLGCAAFLSQAARTISKKPIFLREVLAHEVSAGSDPNAVVQKALQVKAVAVLAVVEGWPAAKVDELSEACSRANLLFRSVASGDAQKKSTAVDIIVDMMLLPGEA